MFFLFILIIELCINGKLSQARHLPKTKVSILFQAAKKLTHKYFRPSAGHIQLARFNPDKTTFVTENAEKESILP